jgi:peroxiredoxin
MSLVRAACCFSLLATVLWLPLQKAAGAEKYNYRLPELGEQAKDFELSNLNGKKFRLSELLKKGPVVVVLLRGYPGHFCPYCEQQIKRLKSHSVKIRDAKATVLLVYPSSRFTLKTFAEKFRDDQVLPAHFHLLLDEEHQFIDAYHLEWKDSKETVFPTTLVIDTDGKIKFKKISMTHGNRATPEEVLQALHELD